MSVKLLIKQCLELLSIKVGCTGLSEATLVKIPHCWKSRVTAHIVFSGRMRTEFHAPSRCLILCPALSVDRSVHRNTRGDSSGDNFR